MSTESDDGHIAYVSLLILFDQYGNLIKETIHMMQRNRASFYFHSGNPQFFLKVNQGPTSRYMHIHKQLMWMIMTDRIQFRTAVTVYRCLYVNRFQNIWLNCAFRCQTDRPVDGFDLPPADNSSYLLTVNLWTRSLAISGHRIWNSLP